MRKSVAPQAQASSAPEIPNWLDLEAQATAELTSEDADHPLEAALKPGMGTGWRASESGPQTVRLRFDQPLLLKRLHLAFREEDLARTQEFLVRWSRDNGHTYQEIVRQQYAFSPPGTVLEVEEYEVDLAGVTEVEITIFPDISGGPARASIAELCLAGISGTTPGASPPGPP